jgi:hypothetical protein
MPRFWSKGFQVGLVHFDRDGFKDQLDRDNKAQPVFSAHQNSIQAGERAGPDAYPTTGAEKRVWFGAEAMHKDFTNLVDFFVWNSSGSAAKAHEVNHARDLLHAQPLAYRQVDEDISGKKRKLEANCAVLPSAGGFELREKILDTPIRELMRNGALMIGAGVGRKPLRLALGLGGL